MLAPVDVTNIRMETPRLLLRPWQERDLEDFYEYASVPGVGEMAGWVHHQDRDVTKAILSMFIRERKTFALVLKENEKVIGSLGLEEPDPDPHGAGLQGREVGYVLSKEHWGKGLMPEAVNAVIAYCFQVLDYDYVTCGHFQKNSQSRRVIEKSGFQYWGESWFVTSYGTKELTQNYIRYNPNKGR